MKKSILIFSIVFTFLNFQEAKAQWTEIKYNEPWTLEVAGILYSLSKENADESPNEYLERLKYEGKEDYGLLGEDFQDAIESLEGDSEIFEQFKRAYEAASEGSSVNMTPSNPMVAFENVAFNILYRDYENRIVIAGNWHKVGISEYRLEATDATVSNYQGGHFVNPKGAKCKISVIGKDMNGSEKIMGITTYIVKPFPTPEMTTKSISKSNGGSLNARFPDSSPVNAYCEVENWEILGLKNAKGEGNQISAEVIKKAKVGKKYAITLNTTNLETFETNQINGIIQIVK